MPKETIARQKIHTDSPEWSLEVRWVKDQFAMVGAHVDGDFDSGQFFSLTRDEINNLIKALRTARNKAYGSDA